MSDQPVIIISLPKSGTYLVAELIKSLGYRATGLHFLETGFTDYSTASLEEARNMPGRFTRREPLASSLKRVQPGEFAVGHLPCTEEAMRATARFKRIYVTRDLRKALISYMRFLRRTGRLNAEKTPWYSISDPRERMSQFLLTAGPSLLVTLYAGMVGWAQRDDVLSVRFEDLTGQTEQATETVESIAAHLDVVPDDPQSILESSLASETITKSKGRTRLEEYWSPEAEKRFRAIGGPELNRRLGCVGLTDERKSA